MSELRIITNHHWRQFSYRYDVPAEILADQFDYQNEDETFDGYFKYRGYWYHLDQFMRFGYPGAEQFEGYDGHHGDSFFSGVLIKISEDGEEFQVATYLS